MEAVKTIIITGGGGHLGRCVARWWANPARQIVLIDRDAGRLDKTRADLAPLGANLTLIAADVTVPDEIEAAAASLPLSFWSSPPSLVLAHAVSGKGAGAKSARLGELDHHQWRDVLDVNLSSVLFAINGFPPYMKRAGGGRIVLVSSTAGLPRRQPPPSPIRFPRRAWLLFPAFSPRARFLGGTDQCGCAGQVLQSGLARRAGEGQALREESPVGEACFGRRGCRTDRLSGL